MSAGDARKRLGELLEGVFYRGDEVVIERAGKAMAVVIPAERYEAMERGRERMFALVEQAHERNRDAPLAEIDDEVAKAIAEVRRGGSTRA
ncbi:MAG: type II toxin-antitoxin system Phd/YefM family antitoxin [Chloroflexi bacterium]|nr:type II toxin-antitoxin system Phd/YefM family antitoxin [Chloroflexota bacterium]